MKDNDLLLYGAAAVGIWYFFLRKPTATSAQVQAGSGAQLSYLQPAPALPAPNNVFTSLANSLVSALNPPVPASTLPATQATDNSAAVQQSVNNLFSTPDLTDINTGTDQSIIPSALSNNTIFNSTPSATYPGLIQPGGNVTDPTFLASSAPPPLTAYKNFAPSDPSQYAYLAGMDGREYAAKIGIY